MKEHVISKENQEEARNAFIEAINLGIDFKLNSSVNQKHLSPEEGEKFFTQLCDKGTDVRNILKEFESEVLPYCTNFGSTKFMGFPDAGNSTASICGALLYNFLQQNLINQSFCSPSGTFVEISVLNWLREAVGFTRGKIQNVFDVGGIITHGGTASNAAAMLLARENKEPGTMQNGVTDPDKFHVILPEGISHYSVRSGAMWAGCGDKTINVKTNDFRYDLDDLKEKLQEYSGKIMSVVAYAGDSRTMTVDHFDKIHEIVKASDPNIWLHADGCHGFSLAFSPKLKNKLNGVEKWDSITIDPHKVMLTPYVISALLLKDPESLKKIASFSDLIMQEDFAFGQVTPFTGSRSWQSLKLWFMMKNFGKKGLAKMIEDRHEKAQYLYKKLIEDPEFVVLNKVEINSVAFMYKGSASSNLSDPDDLNNLNGKIHAEIMKEGTFHLHKFSIPDNTGVVKKGEILFPLRFMSGNPNLKNEDIDEMIQYVKQIGNNKIQEALNNKEK